MANNDDLPDDDEVIEDLIGIEDFEYEGRLFVTARIAPHPTAIRTVFEVPDEGDPLPQSAAALVAETDHPYFWVWKYAAMLRSYVEEVRRRIDIISAEELDPEASAPVGQAFDADSAVGISARQSVIGVRAHTAALAEALFHASDAEGWPEDPDEAAALLELFVDATFAASVLEQLSGQPAIPDDVREAWDPRHDD